MIGFYFKREARLKQAIKKRFARRPVPLSRYPAIHEAAAFADGPVLLVNNALASGGVERQVVNTLRALGQRDDLSIGLLCLRLGFSPDLDFFKPALAGFRGFARNAMSLTDAELALRSTLQDSRLSTMRRSLAWMPADIQEEIIRFAAEFLVLKPRVVHAWQDSVGISATYAAKIVGVPRILISSRNVRPTNFAWYRPYMELGYSEIASCPDIVMINNSIAGAADYAQWLNIPTSRLVVKRNGLDMTGHRRATPDVVSSLRARFNIPERAEIVGSVFRFYGEKRPLLWVEIAREVARRRPETHFVIFGEGPLLQDAVAAARGYGIGDRFHVPGKIDDVAVGVSLFDIFLLTSEFEGTPNVVLEASAVGIPVVATDAGGTAEAIDQDVTGFVVHSVDPSVLADKIVDLLSKPSWRANVATEGPAFVENRFGMSRMIAETLQLYKLPTA
ncbi:MAG: glycosyltransferase [Xanthobacteraceae bacterium]|nr:glycosyltransferase [Xanthobacteraceae bacterium]